MKKYSLRQKALEFSKVTNLPVLITNLENNVLYSFGQINPPFDFLNDVESVIKNMSSNNNYTSPCYENYIIYNIESKKDTVITIVGPFLYHRIAISELQILSDSNNISMKEFPNIISYFDQITRVDPSSIPYLFNYLDRLFQQDNEIVDSQISLYRNDRIFERGKLEDREIDFLHHDYIYEELYLHHLLKGRDTKEDRTQFYKYDAAIFSDDYLRNYKNIMIYVTAIFSRDAIDQGLAPHHSLTIGDAYIREIEKAKNITTLGLLMHQMKQEYYESIITSENQKYSSKVKMAKSFIDHNLTMDINREKIAKYVKVNASYLSRIFKAEIGLSITDYILSEKIKEAKIMLLHSNYSIQEISDLLNFSSTSYFVKRFKQIVGITPKVYSSNNKK